MDWLAACKNVLVSYPSVCFPAVSNAQNPLHTFPHNFPEDGEVANLLRTC